MHKIAIDKGKICPDMCLLKVKDMVLATPRGLQIPDSLLTHIFRANSQGQGANGKAAKRRDY